LFPGTDVPSFPIPPLRGWGDRVFLFLPALGVATQTPPGLAFSNSFPGADVPGFPIPPLRGWGDNGVPFSCWGSDL
jgi:hypothetical protein